MKKRSALPFAGLIVWAAVVALPSSSAVASDVELVFDNDYGGSNQRDDDLYTFGLELRRRVGSHSLVFAERAFTDKRAGRRFDETGLSYEGTTSVPWLPAWSLHLAGGILHVGEGAFGEDLQNGLHSALGNRKVELPYIDGRFHPLLEVEAGRQFSLGDGLFLGPHLEIHSAPGHKSTVFFGVRGLWRYRGDATVRLTVGPKLAHASTPLLAPHVDPVALAWELDVDLHRGVFVTWSRDRYGIGTGHVGVGYRFQRDRTPSRALAMSESRR